MQWALLKQIGLEYIHRHLDNYTSLFRTLFQHDNNLNDIVGTSRLVPFYVDKEFSISRENRGNIKRLCKFLLGLGLDPKEQFFDSSLGENDTLQDYFLYYLETNSSQVGLKWKGLCIAIMFLCELGVDVSLPDAQGLHPLHGLFLRKWSAEQSEGMVEISALLLEYGADPYALTIEGSSVLRVAEHFGWIDEFIKALAIRGIDFDDVVKETEWREWCEWYFKNPGANSTALDKEVMEGPSTAGLARRNPVRGDRLEE